MEPLPIDEVIPEIVDSLRRIPCLAVVAPPGAGKTTRIPPALLRSGLVPRALVMLQPRRVAARAATRRIAAENRWEVGREVGYQVRFERKLSPKTRIQIVTEGILTRRLQSDPFLEGIDAVLLDEFHLRSLEGDLCLALLREVQLSLRAELLILVMSATLEAGPVSAFLGGCPVIQSAGKQHPIDISYAPRALTGPLEVPTAYAVRQCLAEENEGHVLVFLPGAREIRRCRSALEGIVQAEVLALHGSLSAEEQDRAVRPECPRAVILATNVAETSLTIDGVRAVVDSGLVRLNVHDARLGIDRLETRRVSLDAAEQRAGRAGRTAPGRVVRLWTSGQQRELLARTPPEIQRVDLCRVVLELYAWGVDPTEFGWFEAPESAALATAMELLTALGALDDRLRITPLGRRLIRLPLHPRLGVMLAIAHERGIIRDGATLAALLAERDIVRRRGLVSGPAVTGGGAMLSGPSDLLLRFELLERAGGRGRADPEIDRGAVSQVLRVRRELASLAASVLGAGPRRTPSEEDLLRLLFAAFPDRVVKRRRRGDSRGVMVSGRGITLASNSVVRDAELFVALELDGAGSEALVFMASAVDPDWLAMTEETQMRFDKQNERAVAERRWMYRDLCIRAASVPADPREAARIVAEHASQDLDGALRISPAVASFMTRFERLREWMPELELPAMGRDALQGMLPELCQGARSFAELRRIDLLVRLKSRLTYNQLTALEMHAPERIELPSGSSQRLDYQLKGPPVLAVQLQNLFGLAATPTVAGGRVQVLLHLLAPNRRPVQVTQDLKSFWNNTYAQVRKDLRARYPRHSWPEDPWTAIPESRPRRKK